MKLWIAIFALLSLLVLLFLVGCTDNTRVRHFGGEQTVSLPAGRKLVNITWKEASMWILTRPMRAEEMPEEYTFTETSSFGILEGTIIVKETR